MNTKRKGDSTEAFLISKFIECGYDVYPAFGENTRSDMVIDDGELKKVQAKTGRLKDGKVMFNTQSTYSNTNEIKDIGYTTSEIDFFAVYCPANAGVYRVPVEVAPSGNMGLRVEAPKNGQTKGIHWAEDYEL